MKDRIPGGEMKILDVTSMLTVAEMDRDPDPRGN